MMQTIIDWIDPKVKVPPFDTRILVLLGGQGSRDCMQSWTRYVSISDVVILRQSPNDCDGERSEFDCWLDEPDQQAAYDNYQFDVVGWAAHQYEDAGGEFGESAEWYSDAIVAWAPMPHLDFAISTTTDKLA